MISLLATTLSATEVYMCVIGGVLCFLGAIGVVLSRNAWATGVSLAVALAGTILVLEPTHAAIADIVTFSVGAVMCVAGAYGVVVSKNPVHAALSLVTTLFGVAILFVEQEAHFLAAVQVIVYAGAIVVLFLFVIMLLGVDKSDTNTTPDRFKAWRPFAVVLALAIGGLVIALANWNWKATGAHAVGGQASGGGSNIDKLADSIFQQYLFPFEATSLLLVIAVVGAVVLARRPSYEDELLSQGDEEVEIEIGHTGKVEVTQ